MATTITAQGAPEPEPTYEEQAEAYRQAYTSKLQELAVVLPAAGSLFR